MNHDHAGHGVSNSILQEESEKGNAQEHHHHH